MGNPTQIESRITEAESLIIQARKFQDENNWLSARLRLEEAIRELQIASSDLLDLDIQRKGLDGFDAHIERSKAIVASWPEWKRNVLMPSKPDVD